MAKKTESESVTDMFTQFGRDLKLPQMDIERVLERHRKNLEALQKSASASASGASSVMSRQRDMLQEALREAAEIAQGYRVPGSPQEMMAKQMEFARKSFESTVKNAGEAAEIMKKSGTESIEILRKRIQESMEEVREDFDKRD